MEGQEESDVALEWGISYGLEDDEELPADIEDLTDAQYTLYQFVATLHATFEGVEIREIQGEKGSGILVPRH